MEDQTVTELAAKRDFFSSALDDLDAIHVLCFLSIPSLVPCTSKFTTTAFDLLVESRRRTLQTDNNVTVYVVLYNIAKTIV